MDPPAIAKFARNFGVMIIVQGPDPKGLKMRRHAFHKYQDGITSVSASGILLPDSLKGMVVDGEQHCTSKGNERTVVTVASVLESFLSSQNGKRCPEDSWKLIPGAKINVLLQVNAAQKKSEPENLSSSSSSSPCWLPARLVSMVDVRTSLLGSTRGSGLSENAWEIGWSLASPQDGFHPHESSPPTRLAFLRIAPEASMVTVTPDLLISSSNASGDMVLLVGSPFGALSPLHFFNSVSVGAISNTCCSGSMPNPVLLMADIRCLPGMEGGPAFDAQGRLIGILTAPLRHKSTSAEIQLIIQWEAMMTSESIITELPVPGPERHGLGVSVGHETAAPLSSSSSSSSSSSICLVRTESGTWASSVVLDRGGLLLTNAHVVGPFGGNVRVRVPRGGGTWTWRAASAVHVSRGALDVAVLQLEDAAAGLLCPVEPDFACPPPASRAFVVGFGLFGPQTVAPPSVSRGVVSKLVRRDSDAVPVMMETTAAVFPGSSGGAVFNSDARMIGLVTSNALHGGGTMIPYLNFNIPCAAIRHVFEFIGTRDLSLLERLDQPDEELSSIWALVPPPLDPPSPGRGSKFADFIATRAEKALFSSRL